MLPKIVLGKRKLVIGVFAPSEPITRERWLRMKDIATHLAYCGFETRFALGIQKTTYYSAGSIQHRLLEFKELLFEEKVDILFGGWGGRSCIDLLPWLDYEQIALRGKPILGVSDIAVLLNAITAQTGLITFFGPNVYGKLDEVPVKRLEFLKNGKSLIGGANILPASRFVTIQPGICSGRLFGGSLETFTTANAGTQYSIEPERNIFIWETSQYDPQRISQLLSALHIRGVLGAISGMIIGHLGRRPKDLRWPTTTKTRFLKEIFSHLHIPILYAPVFGHAKLYNPVFPIGAVCELDTRSGTLSLAQEILQVEKKDDSY